MYISEIEQTKNKKTKFVKIKADKKFLIKLQKECNDYLEAVAKTGDFLYRGIDTKKEYEPETIFPIMYEDIINKEMTRMGFKATRNSIYAGPLEQASEYGNKIRALILPNKSNITWSPKVYDLHHDWPSTPKKLFYPDPNEYTEKDYKDLSFRELVQRGDLTPDIWQKTEKWIRQTVHKLDYHTNDIIGAINAKVEVMIDSPIIYELSIENVDLMLDFARGKSIDIILKNYEGEEQYNDLIKHLKNLQKNMNPNKTIIPINENAKWILRTSHPKMFDFEEHSESHYRILSSRVFVDIEMNNKVFQSVYIFDYKETSNKIRIWNVDNPPRAQIEKQGFTMLEAFDKLIKGTSSGTWNLELDKESIREARNKLKTHYGF